MNEKQIEAYKKILCTDCIDRIVAPLQEVCDLMNTGRKVDKAKATVKLVRLQKKLYKSLCQPCLQKMIGTIPKVGQ